MPSMLDSKQINHSTPRSRTISTGANVLISNNKAPTHMSFAQQLTQMRHTTAQERTGLEPNKLVADETLLQDMVQKDAHNSNSTHKQHASSLLASDLTKDAEAELKQLKELREHEVDREMKHIRSTEESIEDAEEISNKFNKSEMTVADVGQLNHKQVTEAIREGNVAQQDSPNNDSGSRRKQLENWEDLAPKVIEDPINKAVRIDIPGMNDVETLIVRMNRGAVGIQVVGSKDAMGKLMSGESELAKRLREHNIVLDSLKAFDGDVLRNNSAGQVV